MALRPLTYHIFRKPLPYIPALALQEQIHSIQARSRQQVDQANLSSTSLASSTHPDVLLLLEHRPVYTAGRRQDAVELEEERVRLVRSGADWVPTQRGGETTFHGPGQIVGYPLFDLTRMGIRTREHVCRTQNLLKTYIERLHHIKPHESEHTGVFFSDTQKIASIGMQVRHGLTSHGFAINITNEPLKWFDQVIACGLTDVKAASVESSRSDSGKPLDMFTEQKRLAELFAEVYGKELRALSEKQDGEVWEAVNEMEKIAEQAGDWPRAPIRSVS